MNVSCPVIMKLQPRLIELQVNIDEVDGAPCHVQIVGWQFQDEEVLSATETIAEVLNP